jgi:hypothetical protein
VWFGLAINDAAVEKSEEDVCDGLDSTDYVTFNKQFNVRSDELLQSKKLPRTY